MPEASRWPLLAVGELPPTQLPSGEPLVAGQLAQDQVELFESSFDDGAIDDQWAGR